MNSTQLCTKIYQTDHLLTLDQMPTALLVQIISYLNIFDQMAFSSTCRLAKRALEEFWNTRTELHIGSLLQHTFPFVSKYRYYSLRAVRKEVAHALRIIPNYTLRSFRIQPICALYVEDLRNIETVTEKSAKEIFGKVEHLDLRGCSMEFEELQYFANACNKLTSIALTHSAILLPNEENLERKIGKTQCSPNVLRNLRISLPSGAELRKRKEIPAEHIKLVAKLIKLFPYLEIFHID